MNALTASGIRAGIGAAKVEREPAVDALDPLDALREIAAAVGVSTAGNDWTRRTVDAVGAMVRRGAA